MLKNHVKSAWRNIVRHKGSTAINILGLSIGICASLIIYLITSFEFSFDRFHPDKERIYRIVGFEKDGLGNKEEKGFAIRPLPLAMRDELTGFETVTEFHNYYARVIVPQGTGEPLRFEATKRGEQVSPIIIAEHQYFDIFRYQWLQGNAATALNEPFKVVLSEKEAYNYFGRIPLEKIVGKLVFYHDIYLNDSLPLTVSGIVKDWTNNTDLAFKDFISFPTIGHSFLKGEIQLDHWGNWSPTTQGFVKLAKGVTPEQAVRQFPKFFATHLPQSPGHEAGITLQPLSDIHFNSAYKDDFTRHAHLPTLYALIGIAAFILILATANFINLATAQSIVRAKEIGVRKVLGSSRASLRWQFLVETFLVTSLSVVISIAAVYPLLRVFQSIIPENVAFHPADPGTLLFLLLMTILTSLLAGVYPAIVLSSRLPALSLKGHGVQKSDHDGFLRKGLIVFQFAVSLLFIISTLVIRNQIRFIQNKDLGFKKDPIISFRTGWNSPIDKVSLFAERLRQLSSVEMVSTHMETPAAKVHPSTHLTRVDQPEFVAKDASDEMADENYVPLFGLTIIAGRNIRHSDTVREYLVNETCANALGFRKPGDAIGEIAQNGMNDAKGMIVGVVKDFHSRSLHDPITSFFISSDKNQERTISVKLTAHWRNPAEFAATIARIEAIWKELYPDEKFEFSFFDETIDQLYAGEQRTAKMMNTAMVLAIFIACMGLFGLVTFTARQRTREIGIRKVLGASVTGIVAMLSKDFIVLVVIALIIASPIAWYCMHVWLQNFAYRIAINGWLFPISGFAAVALALVTIGYQAIKAAMANPVRSLRGE
ncbi:FtsX-like permease family protein [Dinghuibacter silviterrae]|uniref:ABC-type antimicrobial peptide transport system permease subunit n=1 Tax=Dinghuibacter silviterrae TaxID=1539049 RepID=A0A4R8DV71_9BACT|nr:FtsX-like permease family protein [Dinghuibacter silviterrae]TDX02312.1 ABC-type antimicrobial peptide transport system permease subunit [Dinghuibacter silviterrae]